MHVELHLGFKPALCSCCCIMQHHSTASWAGSWEAKRKIVGSWLHYSGLCLSVKYHLQCFCTPDSPQWGCQHNTGHSFGLVQFVLVASMTRCEDCWGTMYLDGPLVQHLKIFHARGRLILLTSRSQRHMSISGKWCRGVSVMLDRFGIEGWNP